MGLVPVGFVQIPALEEPDTHGFEVIGGNEAEVDQRGLIDGARRLIGVFQLGNIVLAYYRELADGAGSLDAGNAY